MRNHNKDRFGYRHTAFGWIPEEWSYVRVDRAGEVLGGRQRSPHARGPQQKYLRVANVHDGHIDTSDILEMPFTEEERERFILQVGDILFNEGQSLKLIGRCAVYEGSPSDCCFQNTLVRFRATASTNKTFAFCLFQFCFLRGVFASIANQTTSIAHLGASRLASFKIPLPSMAEQERIGEVLSTWDRMIALTNKLIDAKQGLKKGLMQQLFSGRIRFPKFGKPSPRIKTAFYSFPKDWAHPCIQEIAEEAVERNKNGLHCPVYSCSKHEGFVPSLRYFGKQVFSDDTEGYKVIKSGQFGFPSNHIEEGSIGLLTDEPIALVSPIYIVFETKQKSVYPSFLYALFKTETYRHVFASRTNVSVDRRGSLRWKEFSRIRVPLPSIPEQERIAAILMACDRELLLLARKRDRLQEQKRGLMQKLLMGEVRVAVKRRGHRA